MNFHQDIIHEHAAEAAFNWQLRSLAIDQPHYLLEDLRELDDRVAAHIDALRIAGEQGRSACSALLAHEPWALALLTLLSLETVDWRSLEQMFAVAEAEPKSGPIIESAFQWVSPQFLRGTAHTLLRSFHSLQRRIGISCCAMHRTDPGPILVSAIEAPDAVLRACALRAAGQLGRRDLLQHCLHALTENDPACRYWAAATSLVLGDRDRAIDAMGSIATAASPLQNQALGWILRVLHPRECDALLVKLARQQNPYLLIRATGQSGGISYCPWLIEHMRDAETARLAGEAFTFITGADLAALELDRPPTNNLGPNDDPAEECVAMDEDEDLPWPDPDKVARWWQVRAADFAPDARNFLGQPATRSHCLHVLKHGYQRQRIAAAEYLSLSAPGSKLFPVTAPAWRQQRLLAAMREQSGWKRA